jgi:hypothetical protein
LAALGNYRNRVQTLRRLAISLIALFLFAQASVVLAACAMDRASMAQAMTATGSDDSCACGGTEMQQPVTATCMAHCTADLQMAALPVALVRAPATAPALLVPRLEVHPCLARLQMPRPSPLPRRILLHSFLI